MFFGGRARKRRKEGRGFFGNSQARFSDMAGAGEGIDMDFKGRGFLGIGGGKGSALRREKRQLKRLERQGKLGEEGSDRLDYLRNVQKDRAKKAVGAAALAGGAAFGASALAGGLGAGAGGGAGAGAAAAGKGGTAAAGKGGLFKGFGKKFGKNILKNVAEGGFGGGQQAPVAQSYTPQTPSYQSPQPYQPSSASVAPAVNLYAANGMRVRKRPIIF